MPWKEWDKTLLEMWKRRSDPAVQAIIDEALMAAEQAVEEIKRGKPTTADRRVVRRQ